MSYRMQLQGYTVLYLKDLLSPGEIPPTMPGFKKQQGRWANGSLRTARKILPGLLRDRKINSRKRLQAFIHLTGFMIQPLMVISFLLTCLAVITGFNNPAAASMNTSTISTGNWLAAWADPVVSLENLIWVILFPLIFLCTLAPWMSSLTTLKVQGLSPLRHLPTLLVLLLIGFGLSLSNTREAIKALFTNRIWDFSRTPKYADLQNQQEWRTRRYQIPLDPLWMAELLFMIIGLLAIISAFKTMNYSVLLILVPFTVGYAFVLSLSILQSGKSKT
jgi:cellulose synthase/poly-beta-1,6-N-acetylglucosamine synthase-like glycosyltransferase